MSKTLLVKDVDTRALEEFAEWWPTMLAADNGRLERVTRIRLQQLTDVFRDMFKAAYVRGAVHQLEELMSGGSDLKAGKNAAP